MLAKAWERGQEGWPRRFPIVQFPNLPLLIALASRLAAAFATGTPQRVCFAIFAITLGVWAWQEVFEGANWFRRLVGAGGLALALISALANL